jgi:guanine deaminase
MLVPKFNEAFMGRAIELSELASIIKKTGGPFGAVIAKGNELVAEGYNQVLSQTDPTWHAEIQAIRQACKKLGSVHLDGCVLYASTEGCMMCFDAAYLAHLEHIFYGARAEDALKYGGFKNLDFCVNPGKELGGRVITSTEVMRDEAVKIWKRFSEMSDRESY